MSCCEERPSVCEDALHPLIRMDPDPSQRISAYIISVTLRSKAAGPDPDFDMRVRKQVRSVWVVLSGIKFPDCVVELSLEVDCKNFDLPSQRQWRLPGH